MFRFRSRKAFMAELGKLKEQRLLQRMQYPNCATPVVVMPKTNGSQKTCGDYRSTVCQAVTINVYPLPTTLAKKISLNPEKDPLFQSSIQHGRFLNFLSIRHQMDGLQQMEQVYRLPYRLFQRRQNYIFVVLSLVAREASANRIGR